MSCFVLVGYRLTYNRYIKIFWPRNNAFLNATCTTTEVGRSAVERDTKGVVLVELPLTTRHVARVDYDYSVRIPMHKLLQCEKIVVYVSRR